MVVAIMCRVNFVEGCLFFVVATILATVFYSLVYGFTVIAVHRIIQDVIEEEVSSKKNLRSIQLIIGNLDEESECILCKNLNADKVAIEHELAGIKEVYSYLLNCKFITRKEKELISKNNNYRERF